MITKINKIENLGIFENFEWGSDVPLFQKYCLIYGWNGVGKTSLSRVFQHFDVSSKNRLPEDCKIKITLNDASTFDQTSIELPSGVRVFNRFFVEENVKWDGATKGLLHIGKEQLDAAEKIRDIEAKIEKLVLEYQVAASTAQKRTSEYDLRLSGCAAKIKEELLKYDPGKHTYNKRNVEPFLEDITENQVQEAKDSALHESDIRKILSSERLEKILPISFKTGSFRNVIGEVNVLLRRNLTARVLNDLLESEELAQWIRAGLKIHNERGSTTCYFCCNNLSEKRLSELRGHFNVEYENYQKECQQVINQLIDLKVDSERLPSAKSFYFDKRSKFNEAVIEFKDAAKSFNDSIDQVINDLKSKKENPYASVQNVDEGRFNHALTKIQNAIQEVEHCIAENNKQTETLEEVKSENLKKLEIILFSKSYDLLKKLLDEKTNANRVEAGLKASLTSHKKELEGLRNKLDIGIAAEDINKNIAIFLGRGDIRLIVREGEGYQITRNGKLAKNLSEGEKTAIAFIYFISKLKEQDFDKRNGIVFVDDPVSSFDENSIYSAYAFVINNLKDCRQLFISTHNFAFFKLVRNWLGKRLDDLKANKEGKSPEKALLFLTNLKNDESRVAKIVRLDPLLAKNDSEYEFLFKKLNEIKETEGELEVFYPLANMCRKFLEIFLGFKYPRSDDLKSKLDAVAKFCEFDEQVKEDIYGFINRYSHADGSNVGTVDPTGLAKGPYVVESIFSLLEKSDEFHYAQLIRAVR